MGQWHWSLLWMPGLWAFCSSGHGFSQLVVLGGWSCGGFPLALNSVGKFNHIFYFFS